MSDNCTQHEQIKVWDWFVRLFHWTLVVGFATAWLTEDELQWLHTWAGYTVCTLVLARIVWGFIGTRHARFSDFVFAPKTVFNYTLAVLSRKAPRYIGHNPAGGAMIVLLLIMLLLTTLTGMAYYGAEQWEGPLASVMQQFTQVQDWHFLKEIHEFLANSTLLLVGVHVLGVVWESVLHKENLARAMVTGRKRAD